MSETKSGYEMFMSTLEIPTVGNLRDSLIGTIFELQFETIVRSASYTKVNVVLTDENNANNRFPVSQEVFKAFHIFVPSKKPVATMEAILAKFKWDKDLFYLSTNIAIEKPTPKELSISPVLTLEQCFNVHPKTIKLTESSKLRLVHKVVIMDKDVHDRAVPKLQDGCYIGCEEFERKKRKALLRFRDNKISNSFKNKIINDARRELLQTGLLEGIDPSDVENHLFGNIYELINE